MLTLLLKFKINLEEYDVSTYSQHYGPLFHRWLPDGEKDAIVLDTGDPNAELKVWFERLGFKDKDFIEFDYTRREVDPETIPKQAILEAVPLMGLLKIQALSEEESTPLRENKVVHDGWDPPERAQHKLSGFLNTVAALVAGPRFKFPIVNPGNKIMPLEEWEKQDHGC